MKKYLLVGILAVGCGASPEDEELGVTEQAMSGSNTTSFAYGVTTGSSHPPCTMTGTTQVCLVPTSKNASYCILPDSGGLTANETADVAAAVAVVKAVSPGWAVNHLADGSTCQTNNAAPVKINFFSAGCSGVCSSTSSIDGCVCESLSQGSSLSESLPGSYFGMNGGIIHVDRNDINANFTGQAARDVLKHGIGHAFMAVMGIGNRTNFNCSGSSPLSSRCTAPTTFSTHSFATAGETCKLNNFLATNPTTWAITSNCGGD